MFSKFSFIVYLAEHLPLEQGLRRRPIRLVALLDVLAEHLPLEQGLRHYII